MDSPDRQSQITSRVIRAPEKEPIDRDWLALTPGQRMEAVWTLTKACLAWGNGAENELRLDRTATRIQRSVR